MTFSTGPISFVLFSCLVMTVTIVSQGAKSNICTWIHCSNGGLCQEAANTTFGYKCRCQIGFTGLLCDDRVNITTCLTNVCQNSGNCSIASDRLVKCTCAKVYTGARCETLIGNKTK